MIDYFSFISLYLINDVFLVSAFNAKLYNILEAV
jgi:hypothetical protein